PTEAKEYTIIYNYEDPETGCSGSDSIVIIGINCLVCETAFARADQNVGDAYCFIEDIGENPDYNGDPLTSNRWGWTNFFRAEQYVNHTTEEDAIRLTMYAGAGQCDTMKGDIAGTLKLWFINSDLNNPEVG